MRDLQLITKKCIEEVEAAGITLGTIRFIKENNRFSRTWGCCKRIVINYDYCKPVYGFDIEISSKLLRDTTSLEGLKNTIIHELLHTVKGCFNHGTEWKYYADIMNRKYNYNIKRVTSNAEKDFVLSNDDYKYIVKCPKCGKEWGFHRICNVAKYPSIYLCKKCNENLIRIK